MRSYRRVILGIISVFPLILFLLYSADLGFGTLDLATDPLGTLFQIILSIGALAALGLLIYDLVHAFLHPGLSLFMRIIWIIALALIAPLSMPLYWVLHLRDELSHHPLEEKWY